jgi:hypothetical protein
MIDTADKLFVDVGPRAGDSVGASGAPLAGFYPYGVARMFSSRREVCTDARASIIADSSRWPNRYESPRACAPRAN